MEEAVEGEEHCCGSEDRTRMTGGEGGVEEDRLEKSTEVTINNRNSSPFRILYEGESKGKTKKKNGREIQEINIARENGRMCKQVLQ